MRLNMTEAEQALWQRIKGHKVAGLNFRRQQVIDGFIVDFYCHRARLAIEVDGAVHGNQEEHDRQRDAVLGTRGITVLRFTNDQVFREIHAVLSKIADAARTDPPPEAR
jgi:very-short-patch-repair endonuclease